MRNLAGSSRKRSRQTRKKENQALAMEIADRADAVVAPSPYTASLKYLPSKQKVTLRYAQKVSINSVAAGVGNWNFWANSLYDPDSSGTGHQPRGFDQLISMYDHYQVIGSKITISCHTPSNEPCIFGITLQESGVAGSTYLDYLEERPQFTTYTMLGGGQQPHHLSLTYSQKKFFGTGELDDKYQGSASANPSDGAIFQIFQTDIDDVTAIGGDYLVVIDYITIFTEPKQPPQS